MAESIVRALSCNPSKKLKLDDDSQSRIRSDFSNSFDSTSPPAIASTSRQAILESSPGPSSSSTSTTSDDDFSEKIGKLVDMGLREEIAAKALWYTGNKSLHLALNWAMDNSSEDLNTSLENFVPGVSNESRKPDCISSNCTITKEKPCTTVSYTKTVPSASPVSSVDETDSDNEMDEAKMVEMVNNYIVRPEDELSTSSSDFEDDLHTQDHKHLIINPPTDDSDEEEEDYDLYKVAVVVNGGLKMGPGRVATQVAHSMLGLCRSVENSRDAEVSVQFGIWQDMGEDIVVVRGNSTVHLRDLRQIAEDLQLVHFLVEIPINNPDNNVHPAAVLSVFGNEEALDNIMGRLPKY